MHSHQSILCAKKPNLTEKYYAIYPPISKNKLFFETKKTVWTNQKYQSKIKPDIRKQYRAMINKQAYFRFYKFHSHKSIQWTKKTNITKEYVFYFFPDAININIIFNELTKLTEQKNEKNKGQINKKNIALKSTKKRISR